MLTSYFADLAGLIDKLTTGAAVLEKLEVHGPPTGLGDSFLDSFQLGREIKGKGVTRVYVEVEDGYFSKLKSDEINANNTLITMHPHYKVKNWEQAQPIVQEIIEKAAREPGCVLYSWHVDGDSLVCREAFLDSNALFRHLVMAGPLREALIAGPTAIERIEVHGPKTEITKIKQNKILDKLGTKIEFYEESVDLKN